MGGKVWRAGAVNTIIVTMSDVPAIRTEDGTKDTLMMRWMLIPLLVGLVAMGCSGPDDGLDEDAAPGEQRGRFGLVHVTYDHDWAESGDAVLLTTTAQFVRYAAMDRDQVSRLLALPLDPDHDLPALDQCKRYDLSVDMVAEEALEAEETGNVELLEAGQLKIQTKGETVTLSPRHFPWLLPFISGVVYGEAQTSAVNTVSGVRAVADGGEAIGAFTAQVESPTLPRLLQVGTAQPSALISASRTALNVRWSADDKTADVTYAELRYTRGKRDVALRCRVRDDGSFELPASLLAEISGKTTLELVRLRRAPFTAAGLEQGELRLAVRDRASVQFE